MNMSTFPSRKISHATAWLLLAIAVAGFVRIAGRPDDVPSPDLAPEARATKYFDRRPSRITGMDSPQKAVEAIIAHEPSVERDQTLRQAVGTWAEEAPEDALAWVRRLDQVEDRDWLMGTALTALAEQDASKAAAFLEVEMPLGLARNHALVAIAQRWVQRAPEDAKRWLESLEPSPVREDALKEIGLIRAALSAAATEESATGPTKEIGACGGFPAPTPLLPLKPAHCVSRERCKFYPNP